MIDSVIIQVEMYEKEVLNMLHDFGYYNILEEIKII